MAKQFHSEDIKIAAFDLDGTVMLQGDMSPAVEKALRSLSERGIAVTVATARDISQIPPNVLSCFKYRVTANGANVSDDQGNVIYDCPMEPKVAIEALSALHKSGGRSCCYLNGFVLASPAFIVRLLRRTNYLSKSHRKSSKGLKNNGITLHMGRYVKKRKKGVYRLQTFFKNLEDAQRAQEALNARDRYTPILLEDASIETTLKDVTKSNSLRILCEKLGCTTDNMISFGDSANDLGMLRISGYSVGMGNAEACVKTAVDYITDPVTEDGVATAIEKLFRTPS